MNWKSFGHNDEMAKMFAETLSMMRTLQQQMITLQRGFDFFKLDEHKRFDHLLQQFINLAAHKNAPLSPGSPPDPLAGLSLFEEVPIGDKNGYREEELDLGGEYREANEQ